jgi:hypothetical protein
MRTALALPMPIRCEQAGGASGRASLKPLDFKEVSCPKSFSMLPVGHDRRPRCPASMLAARRGTSANTTPADPPTVGEIVAVMRHAGTGLHAGRTRALIIVL